MSGHALYIGIDVSKATLDIAIRPTGQGWRSRPLYRH